MVEALCHLFTCGSVLTALPLLATLPTLFRLQIMDLLKDIQRKWVYLEPIFGRGALPKEQGRFRNVDTDFKVRGAKG